MFHSRCRLRYAIIPHETYATLSPVNHAEYKDAVECPTPPTYVPMDRLLL